MKKTLALVSELYELVDRMRVIIGQLHGLNVTVRIGSQPSAEDPLGTRAVILVKLNPGCDDLRSR